MEGMRGRIPWPEEEPHLLRNGRTEGKWEAEAKSF